MAEIEDVMEKLGEMEAKIGELETKMDEDRIVYTNCSGCNAAGMIGIEVGCEACSDTPGFRVHGKTGKVD